MKIGELGEFGWIARIEQALRAEGDGVTTGIGDDAAVLDAGGEIELVATCDCQVEGTHFRSAWIEPAQLGRRLAAINLSDIAAMGAKPRWALASLIASRDEDVERIDRVFRGLVDELERAGASLVGGNTARGDGALMVDLFLLGEVDKGRALLRSNVQPGDAICVTGDLGASRAGLIALGQPTLECDPQARDRVVARHLEPRARVNEGLVLVESGAVTACIDVSDGLIADAGHLAERSGVTIRLDAARLPVSPDTAGIARAVGRDPLDLALAGGEDFELLFAVADDRVDQLVELVRRKCGTAVHRIGSAEAGAPEVIVEQDGETLELDTVGFDHFRE